MTRKQLWAPWRLAYIAGARTKGKSKKSKCLFCEKAKSKADARNLVVLRGRYGYCILNLFPYNNGHTLVYKVTAIDQYPADEAPAASIFAKTGPSQLILITCDGEWVPAQKSFDKRLVITAKPAYQ